MRAGESIVAIAIKTADANLEVDEVEKFDADEVVEYKSRFEIPFVGHFEIDAGLILRV